MTIQINFCLHGGDEFGELAGTTTSCLTAQNPVTLSSLKRVFPFEGEFHFRLKRPVRGQLHGAQDFVWTDIKENDNIPATHNIIDIQALCISLPPNDDESTTNSDTEEYLHCVDNSLAEASLDGFNRPDRKAIKSSHLGADVDPITMVTSAATAAVDMAKHLQSSKTVKSMTKTAGSLWSTMKSAATSVGLQLVTPTDNLEKLHGYLSAHFDNASSKHNGILEGLWDALFPGYLFEADSPRWKTAGFQNTDPTQDLKGSGILSLKAMLYMAKTYPQKTQQMLLKNTSNVKTNYPFAVVGINMTILLCDILGIREKRYTQEDEHSLTYFEIFEDRKSFYEIYCFCFFYLDRMWMRRNAVRKDFVSLIDGVKNLVTSSMDQCPGSVDEFLMIAGKSEDVEGVFECASY